MIICTKYLITGDGKTVLEDKAVLTDEQGKIKKISTKEDLIANFPNEEVKDFGNATLLPGLCDMHVHLGYYFSQPDTFLMKKLKTLEMLLYYQDFVICMSI